MDHRFIESVRKADADVTSTELADIVWLATHMSDGGMSSHGPRGSDTPPATTRPLPPSSYPDHATPPQERSSGTSKAGAGSPPRSADMRLPPRRFASDDPGVSTRSPAVPAIPSELAVCRALSPLQRRAPSTSHMEPDEEATARWIAETGLWIPTVVPVSERWLDVALVVDDSESMSFWRQTVKELRTLLERTGAFRDVRVWRMDGDLRRIDSVSISSGVGGWRRPEELVDPTGRRLILIATDCVGPAWASSGMAAALRLWSSAMPTAIVQMLPQGLWRGCAPQFVPVRMRGLSPGVPNSRLVVEVRTDEVNLARSGVPVPVLELEARWLRPWAALVAGAAGSWVNGTAVFTGSLAAKHVEQITPPFDLDPEDRVQTFRAHASPTAFQLALFLAAGAPLTLTVMRIVQGAMLPTSRPSHLAEVFLLGLLRKAGRERVDEVLQNPDEIEYEFQSGVREILLGELPRSAALQVLATVSNFVSQRMGSPLDFRALLTSPDVREGAAQLSRPFARVAYTVLHALGGRYAEAANRLTRMAQLRGAALGRDDSPRPSVPYGGDRPDTHEPGEDVTSPAPPATDSGRGQDVLPRIMRGIPSRNPRFTGRDDLIGELHRMLVSGTERTALLPHTLHGLGGVGKTHLAIEYVYRFAQEYDLICWLPAHDLTQVRASLVELGSAMGLPDNPNVSRGVEAVLDALRTRQVYRRWLLVFDNADNPEELRPYLPYPTGHVLITSRNSDWAEVANAFEIDVFDRQESIALLRQRAAAISDEDANRLADRLGDLPLAIDQAGAWQAATGMPVEEYLRLFDRQFARLTDHPAGDYPTPVGATYALTLERLREEAPGAAQLLDVCAFFGAEPISVDLLWDGRSAELPSPLDQTLRDRIQLRRALREISRYALARVDAVNDQLTVHRLVQVVLRSRLSEQQQRQTRLAAQHILAAANPGEPDTERNWPRHGELSPHIVPAKLLEAEEEPTRRVVLDQIRYRWSRGDYESSRGLGELTVEQWREHWGADDLLTLLSFRHLAVALRTLGDYGRARALAEEALTRFREVLGSDHEHTLFTADSVAWDQRISGNFAEARRLDEDNLARFRREYEPDHPLTLKALNNFAIDLRWLGDFAQARKEDEESVRLRRGLYGEENRNTQLAIASLARDHYGLGNYDEGLRLQESALEIQHRLLGPIHAEVLSETRNLVILLRKTGRVARARLVAQELVATYKRFGPNDEPVLAANMSYFNALRASAQLELAQQVGIDTLSRYRRAFGPEHPATLACASNLAIVLRHQGSVREALELNQATLDAFHRVLGEEHPFALCCATNTANDLAALHRYEPARELSEDTLRRSREVRGDDHPYTLACALNVALDRRATGDEAAVEPLLGETIAGFRLRLGDDHPETRSALDNRRTDCDIEPPEV
jgi:tetratricopeptide (TPR) repeat protein